MPWCVISVLDSHKASARTGMVARGNFELGLRDHAATRLHVLETRPEVNVNRVILAESLLASYRHGSLRG